MPKLGRLIPIVGIIFFIYLIINIGTEKIAHAFSLIPWWYYLIATLLSAPRLLLVVYKWQYICKKQRMNFDFFYLIKLFLLSLFYAAVTPGAIGVHVRVYYMKQKIKTTLGKCIANSFIDSLSAAIGGISLATAGALIYVSVYPSLFTVLAASLLFYIFIFVIFIKKRAGSRFFHLLIKPLLPERYHKNFHRIINSMYEDMPSISELIPAFVIELPIWVVAATQVYVLAYTFSLNISYIEFVVIEIIAVAVAISIPISIGGLGIREGAFLLLLTHYGAPPEIAFVLSLGGFMVKDVIPGTIGFVFPLLKNGKDTILHHLQ